MDEAKKLLNRLLGNARNLPEALPDLQDACRYHLAGGCPQDILRGTKRDIGRCKRRHDWGLTEEYEKLGSPNRQFYEDSLRRALKKILEHRVYEIEEAIDVISLGVAGRVEEALERDRVLFRGALIPCTICPLSLTSPEHSHYQGRVHRAFEKFRRLLCSGDKSRANQTTSSL
jgi:LUC7 N_terminus